MTMSDRIYQIVSELDTGTKLIGTHSQRPLALLGPANSPYLNAVATRAGQMGIPFLWGEQLAGRSAEDLGRLSLVWDIKYHSWSGFFDQCRRNGALDPDSIRTEGVSCCSMACQFILDALPGPKPTETLVAISGRGHAQKYLIDNLRYSGYSTIAVHHDSARELIRLAATEADVVINTSPYIKWPWELGNTYVLDTVGTAPHRRDWPGYIGPKAIGALTVSVLLRRYANMEVCNGRA